MLRQVPTAPTKALTASTGARTAPTVILIASTLTKMTLTLA